MRLQPKKVLFQSSQYLVARGDGGETRVAEQETSPERLSARGRPGAKAAAVASANNDPSSLSMFVLHKLEILLGEGRISQKR